MPNTVQHVLQTQRLKAHDNSFYPKWKCTFLEWNLFIFTSLHLMLIISHWLTSRFGCLGKWDPSTLTKEVFPSLSGGRTFTLTLYYPKHPQDDCTEDCTECQQKAGGISTTPARAWGATRVTARVAKSCSECCRNFSCCRSALFLLHSAFMGSYFAVRK